MASKPNGPTCPTCLLGGRCTSSLYGSGFAAPHGAMLSGVMIVTESLTTVDEVKAERALAGPGGFLLARAFTRNQWKLSEDFRIVPALRCMPNQPLKRTIRGKSVTNYWASQALNTCDPNLDIEIDTWKPKVIVALGDTAFTALTGIDQPVMAARGYVFREKRDRCWVVPTFDPTWIQQGQAVYAQILLRDVEKARDIAVNGFEYDQLTCLLDPPEAVWDAYVEDGLRAIASGIPLALDIETPWKSKADGEDELEGEEVREDITYQIDRISFAFEPHRGASVAWDDRYLPGIRRLVEAATKTP